MAHIDACIIEQEQDSDINTDKPLESSPPEQVFAEEVYCYFLKHFS